MYDLLGQNVKRYRLEKGLTQEQVANKIDLTRTSIVNIEQGRQHPPIHILLDLAKALGILISDLIPKEEEFEVAANLEDYIPKNVSSGDVEKLTSFLEKFLKTTGSHE